MTRQLRTAGDGPAMWEDWARASLLERRTVFLTGTLDDGLAGRLAGELMLLDAMGDELIELQVDCGDGTLDAALTLIDVIDLLGVPVHATCVGRAEGPALAVFAVATQRVAKPHARFRLTEPVAYFAGRASVVESCIQQHRSCVDRLCVRLAEATGQPAARVREHMARGAFWDPAAARANGFVDAVATPEARILRFPRRVGFRPDA
jgi:ATP-dependent Clp protease protease subunit